MSDAHHLRVTLLRGLERTPAGCAHRLAQQVCSLPSRQEGGHTASIPDVRYRTAGDADDQRDARYWATQNGRISSWQQHALYPLVEANRARLGRSWNP